MPRPITMTDEMKQKALTDFGSLLDNLKMSDGKLNYKCDFGFKEDLKATVLLTGTAYQKTVALLAEHSDEVAWHGSVTRSGEHEFTIEDVFVYPQEVTQGTVTTDQAAYTEWLYELDDELFSKIRMQGHSHVNMNVNPSGVDEKHRQQILEQLESDMFYVFMIWNKSLDVHTLIYDMSRNILYEDKDVEIKHLVEADINEFLIDAREKVQKRNTKKSDKKAKKSREEKRLEQIQLEEYMAEFGDYPFPESSMRDPFFVGDERLWQH